MSIIRTDKQMALHDLLIAIEESSDQYQDAAEFLRNHQACVYFEQFAKQRLILTSRLEQAIRSEGDLPSAPDPDRESSAMAFQHMLAHLSQSEASTVIEQRLEKEEEINELVQTALEVGVDKDYPALITDLNENNRLLMQCLQDLLEHAR